MKLKNIFIYSLPFLLAGCGLFTNSSGNSTETKNYVEVFTLAPVKNVLIQDANNQIAKYDPVENKYYFEKDITYPITVTTTSNSYIDVDYDSQQTANDIKPLFTTLKSFTNEVNYYTNYYYEHNLSDQNITVADYINELTDKYNINIYDSPLTDTTLATKLFGVFNYIAKNGQFDSLDNVSDDVAQVTNFFNNYISDYNNSVEYYSFYDSLLLLDKKEIQRVDTLHKPTIKIIRQPLIIEAQNNQINVFDILEKNSTVYTASGHDELAILSDNLNLITTSTPDTYSFGRKLYDQSFENEYDCLFLADSLDGFKVFDILNPTKYQTAHILTYKNDNGDETYFTSSNVLSLNGYVSNQGTKRLLGVSTDDNGFYLINADSVFNKCSQVHEINSSDFLIPATGGNSVSSAFRNDGTYLYVSQVSSIDGYNLSVLNQSNILNSKVSFTPQNGESIYNISLVNNDNQLFAGTNKGIQVYSVDNANNLHFISEYDSEGATDNYHQQFIYIDGYLVFTDGYKGLKVLKYDSSFNPMLCGVEYFSPTSYPTEMAKVNSVTYKDGYLYVGVDSLGIIKFKFKDILFDHCK